MAKHIHTQMRIKNPFGYATAMFVSRQKLRRGKHYLRESSSNNKSLPIVDGKNSFTFSDGYYWKLQLFVITEQVSCDLIL